MKSLNLIDQKLWEAARWRETAFLLTLDLDQPAGLALQFENFAAGQRIFTNWRNAFGEYDAKELLRVSILHGRAPTNENGYTVHLTTDPLALVDRAKSRPQTMAFWSQFFFKQTTSNQSLNWFITSFERHRQYYVLPVPMRPEPNLSVYFGHRLWKTKLHHGDYSKVKPTDLDAIALPR